jgi:hypothetical protein
MAEQFNMVPDAQLGLMILVAIVSLKVILLVDISLYRYTTFMSKRITTQRQRYTMAIFAAIACSSVVAIPIHKYGLSGYLSALTIARQSTGLWGVALTVGAWVAMTSPIAAILASGYIHFRPAPLLKKIDGQWQINKLFTLSSHSSARPYRAL